VQAVPACAQEVVVGLLKIDGLYNIEQLLGW
jgi:hypothetical protein